MGVGVRGIVFEEDVYRHFGVHICRGVTTHGQTPTNLAHSRRFEVLHVQEQDERLATTRAKQCVEFGWMLGTVFAV